MRAVPTRFAVLLFTAVLGAAGCYRSYPFEDEELDGGRRRDAGGGGPSDAGATTFDAGPPTSDAGPPPPPRDAGPLLRDAGVPRRDAGVPPPPPDAGPPPPPRDTGPPPPPPDAGPGSDAGRVSVALAFDPNEQLVVASAPSLDLTHSFTFELWLRVHAGTRPGFLCRKGDPMGRRYMYGVRVDGTDVFFGWGVESGATHEVSVPVPADEWHHVAFVVLERGADVEASLYLDARLVGTFLAPNDLPSAVNDYPLVFGNSASTFDLDEVRIWSLSRDATTLAAFFRSRIDPGLAGLEAYLPLEEAGQLALDRTLHGHDAVLGRLTIADGVDPAWIADGAL